MRDGGWRVECSAEKLRVAGQEVRGGWERLLMEILAEAQVSGEVSPVVSLCGSCKGGPLGVSGVLL